MIDIGEQDCKVILLSPEGDVRRFEMNDRCAAGTGKFLEVMARTLEVDIGAFSDLALSTRRRTAINSLCTVFADSEVVSLIGRGEEAADIALAPDEAIATRVATMARRVGVKEKVVLAGGASVNGCPGGLLEERLGTLWTYRRCRSWSGRWVPRSLRGERQRKHSARIAGISLSDDVTGPEGGAITSNRGGPSSPVQSHFAPGHVGPPHPLCDGVVQVHVRVALVVLNHLF